MGIEVKYALANLSKHAKEPKQATIDSVGYDLALEAMVLVQQVFNSFCCLIKMSSGEVDHVKQLFF